MAEERDLRKQQQEVERRLAKALDDIGRSALGMPTAPETLKAWLAQAGLCLVLRPRETGQERDHG